MINQDKVMKIVKKMGNAPLELVDCRGLNNSKDARLLMNMIGIPSKAEIFEIPVADGNQTVIYFSLPDDDNCYNLFAGLGWKDKKFYFHATIMGKIDANGHIHDFEDGKESILDQDYFVNESIKNVWGKTFDEIFEKYYNIEYEVSHYTEHKRLIETGHNENEAKTAAHNKAHGLAVRIAGEKACNAADAALSEYHKDNGGEN